MPGMVKHYIPAKGLLRRACEHSGLEHYRDFHRNLGKMLTRSDLTEAADTRAETRNKI